MNYNYQPQGGYNQPYLQQMPQYAPQYPMDRLAQLQAEAQMRDAQAQMQVQNQQTPGMKLIPVGSVEEAKGFLSPANGEKIYFVNSSNSEIYSKQLDFNTGKSIFLVYKLSTESEEPKKENIDFIKREELDSIKTEYAEIKKEISKIKKMIKEKLEPDEEE